MHSHLVKMFFSRDKAIPTQVWSNLRTVKIIYEQGTTVYEDPTTYEILKNNVTFKITVAGESANKVSENSPLSTVSYDFPVSNANRGAYGGMIVWTTNSLRKHDIVSVKSIRGGVYDAEDYSLNYIGGCGVAVFVNNVLKLVAGGGGCCDNARTYSSSGAGGGGYYGGSASGSGWGIGSSGWGGYAGHVNADGGTMRECYGGSSYVDPNISSNEISFTIGCSGYSTYGWRTWGNPNEPTSGNKGSGFVRIEKL